MTLSEVIEDVMRSMTMTPQECADALSARY